MAAIQICLGAGARRTHRARNLRELVRKEAAATSRAIVRVTVLNMGDDAYLREKYGDEITVERTIDKTGTTVNPYKLLDKNGKVVSRLKSDLDAMLDQLNIQVENPVAVLDQEEAKKFLSGKPEDKYNFFQKATELERIDHTYANTIDNIDDLEEKKDRVYKSFKALRENVLRLENEWKDCQEMEKLEVEMDATLLDLAWSLYNVRSNTLTREISTKQQIEDKLTRRRADLAKLEAELNSPDSEKEAAEEKLQQLTDEAMQAAELKQRLDAELRAAILPIKQNKQEQSATKQQIQDAKVEVSRATKRLQSAREQFLNRAGNSKNEIMKCTEDISSFEAQITEATEKFESEKRLSSQYLEEHEGLTSQYEYAQNETQSVTYQFQQCVTRVRELESSNSFNNVSIFGAKSAALFNRVEDFKRRNKFQGPVFGPIGAHISIAQGMEKFAKLAERAVGGIRTLDRFVCTTDGDRQILTILRQEVGCVGSQCGIWQMSPDASHAKYKVKEALPEGTRGVETVISVLAVEEALVYNCLVDYSKIDVKALAENKDVSEEALLSSDSSGRESIRGGKIQQVFFLPHGDFWQVRAGVRSMTSASQQRNQRQYLGVDRTEAIRAANEEAQRLKKEIDQRRKAELDIAVQQKAAKKNWNKVNASIRSLTDKIQRLNESLEASKEQLNTIEAESGDGELDTSDLEQDVKNAQDFLGSLEGKLRNIEQMIQDKSPEIEVVRQQHDEVRVRNQRVIADIEAQEKVIHELARNVSVRAGHVEKQQKKATQLELALQNQIEVIRGIEEQLERELATARLQQWKFNNRENEEVLQGENPTEEDLADISEIRVVDREPEYYKSKRERQLKRHQSELRKRQLSSDTYNPDEIKAKYERAANDLNTKMSFVDKITDNIEALQDDLRNRRKRFKQFRKHIADMTNNTFDEQLNRKGSSGQVEFDHKTKQLHLIVQKDAMDDLTQTRDVKALSGGERSYTTLSLLIALGEHLETPFRVMDEFDVFLDPIARKIALDSMIDMAKSLSHRQFIFITPQDLSNLQPDPLLKIHRMKPPERGQRTLDG